MGGQRVWRRERERVRSRDGGREGIRIINGTVGRPTILGPLVSDRSPRYRLNLNSRKLPSRRTIKRHFAKMDMKVDFVEEIEDLKAVATANKYSALSVALTHCRELDQISEWKTEKELGTNGLVFKF